MDSILKCISNFFKDECLKECEDRNFFCSDDSGSSKDPGSDNFPVYYGLPDQTIVCRDTRDGGGGVGGRKPLLKKISRRLRVKGTRAGNPSPPNCQKVALFFSTCCPNGRSDTPHKDAPQNKKFKTK
ncbi:hypothetical protein CDAR_300201 [Caerostris darwini]|uniref:Uncharacterized protein n=1 Tax=Caerostris darwini TaxID=1538125 RepID=A0AAV4W4N1_9ARAC|nr:hypothetical protein CDAR_300201 [Caerostris darwini]